jgi:hypothetical protein
LIHAPDGLAVETRLDKFQNPTKRRMCGNCLSRYIVELLNRDLCKSRAKRGVASGLWPESLDIVKVKSRHSLDATSFAEVSNRESGEILTACFSRRRRSRK